MTIKNGIQWIQARAIASLASYTVRNYFDAPRVPFTFTYVTSVEHEQQDITLSSGEKRTIKRDKFGGSTPEGVILYGKTNSHFAEHEFTHFYHMNLNQSVIDLSKREINMRSQMKAGIGVPLNDWLAVTGSANIAMEALAYCFNERKATIYSNALALVYQFETDSKKTKRVIVEQLEKNAEMPEVSVASALDRKSFEHCKGDQKRLDDYLLNLVELEYQIGKESGLLFLVSGNQKPIITLQHEFDRSSNQLILGIAIEYPLVPIQNRQHILQGMFDGNVNMLRDQCVGYRAHMIDPYLKESFGKLALAVKAMKLK